MALRQNSLQCTCFSASQFADFQFRYICHIKQQNIGPYQANKFKNVMYNLFLSLLDKTPRGLTLCCQYRNVRVHALKNGKKRVNECTRKKPIG